VEAIALVGLLFCLTGLLLLLWSVVSFGRSFRVGIDTDRPNRLITNGIFSFSRNPIYAAFAIILIGEFLILPNWITLIYIAAATWLFHRQVLLDSMTYPFISDIGPQETMSSAEFPPCVKSPSNTLIRHTA
jgi:protein-S-isoprenylcysteine O-methyltransferase Ste14